MVTARTKAIISADVFDRASFFPRGVLYRKDKTTINKVIPIKIGDDFRALMKGSFLERMVLIIIFNIPKAIIKLKIGEIIQLKTTAPNLPQLMTEKPPAIIPKPIMEPTIEWVVETGKDFQVAKLTQSAAARRADKAPIKAT